MFFYGEICRVELEVTTGLHGELFDARLCLLVSDCQVQQGLLSQRSRQGVLPLR